jgi:hypothetical protein
MTGMPSIKAARAAAVKQNLVGEGATPHHAPLTYNVRQLAAATGTSQSLLWKEIAAGELETLLIGDRRLATPAQIERWLARKTERARQKASQPRRRRDERHTS